MFAGQDAGGFSHEVHAAENDEISLRMGCRFLTEQEGITLEIRVLDDFLALIVVPQHRNRLTQSVPGGSNPLVQLSG